MTEGFCEKCRAGSTDESSGSIKEGLFGHEFKGEAAKCPECGSHVAVLWRQFAGFPVKLIGCYRYKLVGAHFGGVDFLSRRVPDDQALIRRTRLNSILFTLAIFAAIGVYEWWRRSHR
ncbi:MAG: hypothetical protein HY927_04365 [Elusimicrobia bacterium]|nr:hypothetical protein [Elusimicrobiota bacterium]